MTPRSLRLRPATTQHVKKLYPQPLAVVGDCSRSMITAAPGHELIGADFSAIESRVLAWVAGEDWKLDAYRRFDATRDPRDEPYCETACKIFRVPSGTYTKDFAGAQCRQDLRSGVSAIRAALNAWRKFEPDKFTDDEVETLQERMARGASEDHASSGTTSIVPPCLRCASAARSSAAAVST